MEGDDAPSLGQTDRAHESWVFRSHRRQDGPEADSDFGFDQLVHDLVRVLGVMDVEVEIELFLEGDSVPHTQRISSVDANDPVAAQQLSEGLVLQVSRGRRASRSLCCFASFQVSSRGAQLGYQKLVDRVDTLREVRVFPVGPHGELHPAFGEKHVLDRPAAELDHDRLAAIGAPASRRDVHRRHASGECQSKRNVVRVQSVDGPHLGVDRHRKLVVVPPCRRIVELFEAHVRVALDDPRNHRPTADVERARAFRHRHVRAHLHDLAVRNEEGAALDGRPRYGVEVGIGDSEDAAGTVRAFGRSTRCNPHE